MVTKYYAEKEINWDNIKVPAGEVVATLESPDGIPVQNILRAVNSGIVSTNPPKAKTETAPANPSGHGAE